MSAPTITRRSTSGSLEMVRRGDDTHAQAIERIVWRDRVLPTLAAQHGADEVAA